VASSAAKPTATIASNANIKSKLRSAQAWGEAADGQGIKSFPQATGRWLLLAISTSMI